MITKRYHTLALIVPLFLVLMLIALAHHVHCVNSYHSEDDSCHASFNCSVSEPSQVVAAEIQAVFSHASLILVEALLPPPSLAYCPLVFVPLTHSRAPPD